MPWLVAMAGALTAACPHQHHVPTVLPLTSRSSSASSVFPLERSCKGELLWDASSLINIYIYCVFPLGDPAMGSSVGRTIWHRFIACQDLPSQLVPGWGALHPPPALFLFVNLCRGVPCGTILIIVDCAYCRDLPGSRLEISIVIT